MGKPHEAFIFRLALFAYFEWLEARDASRDIFSAASGYNALDSLRCQLSAS